MVYFNILIVLKSTIITIHLACGGGQQIRTRLCVDGNPGEGECVPADATTESRDCNNILCNGKKLS